MKQTIIYSLKVWLTSVVISPVLYIILEAIQKPRVYQNIEGGLGFILFSIIYGLILSLISWILLWLSLYSLLMFNRDIIITKLWLSIIGAILTLLPFWLVLGYDDPNPLTGTALWAASYCLVIIAGIWFYRLKPLLNRKSIIE
jgi:hypothetical protein